MIGIWALHPAVFAELEASAHVMPTAEQLEALGRGEGSPLTVSGSTAEISVRGVLTPERDALAALFGGGNTSYSSIQKAFSDAEADPAVREILFSIDSPGGTVAGLFETLAVIEAGRKPRRVRASLAASAAYALAAVAGPIEATGPAATFGSVGVVATMRVDDRTVSVTSTDAPNKRPDPRTEAGKAAIREELDEVHALFVAAIARGRGTTVKGINEKYGRGGVRLAGSSLASGMIDTIASGAPAALRSSAELGPAQQAAHSLAAQLGSASARGASESQESFARRLLASVAPRKPTKPVKSAAERVADIMLGTVEQPPEEPETRESRIVADLVIAALKSEGKNL